MLFFDRGSSGVHEEKHPESPRCISIQEMGKEGAAFCDASVEVFAEEEEATLCGCSCEVFLKELCLCALKFQDNESYKN